MANRTLDRLSMTTPEQVPAQLRQRSGRMSFGRIFWPALATSAMIGLWELVPRVGIVDPIIVPPASDVATALVDLCQQRVFWDATWVTVQETLAGFVIGVASAWILGTLIGLFRIFRLAFYPLIIAFQIVPRVALAPLFLTWFGFGITSKIVMAATICFFPVLINVVTGHETVDKDARTLMRSFGVSRWEEYRKLTLPSSLPLIFAGIKTAMTLALIGAIVAEFVGGSEGMGVLIKTYNFQLDVAEGFAVIVALSLIGLLLYGLTELAEKRLVFWQGH
jgi:NitT/TauT family transport system permease protein